MEATVVSIGKAVLDGALGYAKSAAAEEMALQLGVERDVSFVTDELEMMQSFLMTADEERDQNNKVLNTWVKQVRDVAYNVEDNLVDFTIHAEREKPPILGCIPRNPCDRRRIALEVKELKAKVEEVSKRNKRYRLIKDIGAISSKPFSFGAGQGGISGAAAAIFGMDQAWGATTEKEKPKVDLAQLIISEAAELQVIAMWGTNGDLGMMSEIWKVYDNPKVTAKFGCRAWVRLTHPLNQKEFIESLVRQFYVNSSEEEVISTAQEGTAIGGLGADVLLKMEKMSQSDLIHVFKAQLRSNSYLIVINNLSTIEEWHCIKTYLPDKKNGSRIVVTTHEAEIASLCTEQPYQVSELKQLSADQVLYLFHKKVEKHETGSAKHISKSSALATTESCSEKFTIEIEVEGGQEKNGVPTTSTVETHRLDRSKTRAAIPEDVVVGRTTEKQKIIDLVGRPDDSHDCKVISVWGMGGIGKTTLVRSVYRSQELGGWKRAWATALRPFNHYMLLRYLALQLQPDIQEDTHRADGLTQKKKKNIGVMGYQEMTSELSRLLETQKCLIVLDDLSSTQEWDAIRHHLVKARRVIVTTREKIVAKHCSEDDSNMFCLNGIQDDAALDLFKKKVFKDAARFDLHRSMLDQAKLILKKCDGLPLAISTIGGYLANKPKTALEWRKLNDGLSAELEINPELQMIKTVLLRSYDGLPYHLKASFLYLSIFPEDHIIQRKSVVRRWIAEGFSREMPHMTAAQVGNKHFDELIDRSMILPLEEETPGKIDSCQLHDLIREICVSKAREENLVFTLEEGCSLGVTQGTIRHLTISSTWKTDKKVMQTMLDLSHLRSLTVFGEWRSFFISSKMRFIRVLDLEHTTGLRDHHLDKIGELLHLRYLSLRGCNGIFVLPDSLANLRQLQTLDIRGTRICTLPTAVTKLQKLQYLHASGLLNPMIDGDLYWEYNKLVEGHLRSISCVLCCCVLYLCTCYLLVPCNRYVRRAASFLSMGHLFCSPQQLEARMGRSGPHPSEDGVSVTRHDLCNIYRYYIMQSEDMNKPRGVVVPRGISKLRSLHTLRGVSVARGKGTTFEELRELTQLRKLGVVGVQVRNREIFWRSIAGHTRLQSLSVYRYSYHKDSADIRRGFIELDDCLGGNLWPPRCLESLKMCGQLVKVTEWIHRLQNLSKLQLEEARLNQDAILAIGMLPNLAVLRLQQESLEEVELHIPGSSFPSLLFLELHDMQQLRSVKVEETAMLKLEVLVILQHNRATSIKEFSGLRFLTSLKEIRLNDGDLKEMVQSQLEEFPNIVTLKML